MPRKSHASQSQSSVSSRKSSQLSQRRIEQDFALSQQNVEDQVTNLVRYFVNNAGQNVYFRRAEIQKHCAPKAGQQLQQLIEQATVILKNVYGYNVLVCDQAKTYIVSNALPYKNYAIDRNNADTKDVGKILMLLILSHIYMSGMPINEASLHSFLNFFNIDVSVRHPLFGSVKEYITNTLIKQKFLAVDTDPVSKNVSYSWGIRAEKEISKHEILKFVCKMFKNCQPKSWENQFHVAEEQRFANNRLDEEGNGMDVDEC